MLVEQPSAHADRYREKFNTVSFAGYISSLPKLTIVSLNYLVVNKLKATFTSMTFLSMIVAQLLNSGMPATTTTIITITTR